jgi:hypothetical protein
MAPEDSNLIGLPLLLNLSGSNFLPKGNKTPFADQFSLQTIRAGICIITHSMTEYKAMISYLT